MDDVGWKSPVAPKDADNADVATGSMETGGTTSHMESSSCVQHPLQNDLILTNLFRFCPPDQHQLSNMRLVCKQWCDHSLPSWRAKIPITFSEPFLHFQNAYDIILGEISGEVDPGRVYRLQDFVHDYVNNPENKTDLYPHRSIRLYSWGLDSPPYWRQSFWDAMGINVTTLELNSCSFEEEEEFQTLIYQTCPNLQTLRLIKCWYNFHQGGYWNDEFNEPTYGEHHHLKSLTFVTPENRYDQRLEGDWLDIFSHFPSLTHFYFEVPLDDFTAAEESSSQEEVCSELLTAIGITRDRNGRNLPFNSFTLLPALDIIPNRETLALMRHLVLPMERVTLRLHLDNVGDDQIVNDILQHFAQQLCKLVVIPMIRIYPMPIINWEFPYRGMDWGNLRSLQMSSALCESLDFLQYTPNLEELWMSNALESHRHGPPHDNVTIQIVSNSNLPQDLKLQKLTRFACQHPLREDDVRNLINWMPNLERLELFLDDPQFEIVCDNWRNLIGLKVVGTRLTDLGITGREDLNEEDGDAPRPNIAYLTKLIYFSAWSNPHITDASVFKGFLHVPLLQRLQIIGEECFSEEATRALSEPTLERKGIRLMGEEGVIERDWEEEEID